MPRDTFPFEYDRAAVRAFLADPSSRVESNHISTTRGTNGEHHLMLNDKFCMRLDADGTLTGVLSPSGLANHYGVKIQNYVLELLGDPRRIVMKPVVREVVYAGQASVASAPYLDDIELPTNAPWVIAGRLTLMAWRAENATKA
jgi:hypothetical protein